MIYTALKTFNIYIYIYSNVLPLFLSRDIQKRNTKETIHDIHIGSPFAKIQGLYIRKGRCLLEL